MGELAFLGMATDLGRTASVDRRHFVSQDQYHEWRRQSVFDALKGLRYGQSFCNTFGITDNHLYYNTGGVDWSDAYIRKTYLARS